MSTAELTFTVTTSDTAISVGSGSLPVLGTPVLLAWCEAATCAALSLPEAETSVGTRVAIEHLKASPIGAVIRVHASMAHRDGRLVRFTVSAYDATSALVGSGEITRVIVNADRFLSRVPPPAE